MEYKGGVIKTLMHRVDTLVSDERDKVEEKSYAKKALNVKGYPDWLIYSIVSTQHSLESTTSVPRNDNSDYGQDTVRDTATKKSTSKKSPVVLPYIKGVSEQIRRIFKQYDIPIYFKPMNTLHQLLIRPKDKGTSSVTIHTIFHVIHVRLHI